MLSSTWRIPKFFENLRKSLFIRIENTSETQKKRIYNVVVDVDSSIIRFENN